MLLGQAEGAVSGFLSGSGKHHHRIRRTILTAPKARGGIGFPHPILYYESSHLKRILAWCAKAANKLWVSLEQDTTEYPLALLPWHYLHDHLPGPAISNPLTEPTIAVSTILFRTTKLSP